LGRQGTAVDLLFSCTYMRAEHNFSSDDHIPREQEAGQDGGTYRRSWVAADRAVTSEEVDLRRQWPVRRRGSGDYSSRSCGLVEGELQRRCEDICCGIGEHGRCDGLEKSLRDIRGPFRGSCGIIVPEIRCVSARFSVAL
jgi:hypothetical protein